MAVLAPLPVIEPVAVANVEALLAAIAPDGELDEPRENGREGRIERTGVDLLGSTGNDFGAAAWPVAAGAVRVGGLEAAPGSRSGAGNCGPGYRPQSGARRLAATSGERQPRRSECRTAPSPAPCRKRRRRCAMARSGQCALATSGSAALWSFTWSSRSSIQPTRSPSATSRMNRYRL